MPIGRLSSRRAVAFLIIIAGATPAIAEETVYLRGGQVVKGKVIDRGATIEVERPLGSVVFDRKDVIRIESDTKPELPAAPEDDLDTVELTDGKILRGRVTISDDGKEVVIATKEIGEARHPIEAVKSIRFKNGRTIGPDGKPLDEPGSKSLREAIDKQLAALKSADPKAREAARAELLELAPFAVQYLQGLQAHDKSDEVKALLEDVIKVRELKAVIAPKIEERVPRVYARLLEKDPEKRKKAVEDIAVNCPDEATPVLLHLLSNDAAAPVRAVCVGELGLLRKFEELAGVLRSQDGQLRLSAAFILADNGIYAGLPVIIDALRLSDAGLRELANDKLRTYTGQEFGFLPRSQDEKEREEGVKRWEAWWAKEGPKIVEKSLKAWREAGVSEEDRASALKEWRSGNTILEAVDARDRGETKGKDGKALAPLAEKDRAFELERAAHAFQKALDADPTLSAARISRAVVLYESLRRPREAEKELRLVLERFSPQEAILPRKMAQYHLGRIYQLDGRLEAAEFCYKDAATLDHDYLEPLVALGDLALDRAFALGVQATPAGGAGGGSPGVDQPAGKPAVASATPAPKPSESPSSDAAFAGKSVREQSIEAAVIYYRQAIAAVNRREEALVTATKDLASSPGGVESFPEGRVLATIREDRASLEKRAAEIYFRLGRAHAARQDERMALDAFRAARRLNQDEKRYSDAAGLWESIVERKSAPAPEKK